MPPVRSKVNPCSNRSSVDCSRVIHACGTRAPGLEVCVYVVNSSDAGAYRLVLHGSDREVVRGRKADEMSGLLLDEHALDPMAAELDRQEQPDGSSPNNDDGNVLAVR